VAERFKYKAYNQKGRPIRGVITAANEVDLYNQLAAAGLDLVSCAPVAQKSGAGISIPFLRRKPKTRDMIQLFISLEQMQSAGVPMLEALADIRESMDNQILRDIMSDVYRDVMEGSSLSDAMNNHPTVFGNLYLALIRAGEATGDLTKSYTQLIKYLKWKDDMETKIRKAKRYPMILGAVVLLTVGVMMGFVVPQVVGFLRNLGQELPFLTLSLIATSDFVREYWWVILLLLFGSFFLFKFLRKASNEFAYRTDALALELPIAGNLIRKINIARYAQTFGSLYSSGIPVINCLKSSQVTVTNLALIEALEATLGQVQTGASLSQAFAASGEFPNLVVRMIKIGEESGNLTPVFDQISEFYTKDVDEAVQGLITMIEPALTLLLGGMILWIAAGVFGPIYSSFEKIDF
jgi:type IV pilus assembly protein PilC